jgi:hypothetical protein
MSTDDSPFRPGTIGIPWCREEDYDAFRAIFEDAHDLPLTWDEFARRAQDAEQHYQAQGQVVTRVYIDPRAFPQWCRSKRYRVNAQARARFARDHVKTDRNR